MDLFELALAAFVLLSIAALLVAIFWPLERRRDDVMQRIHGDQPRLPQ